MVIPSIFHLWNTTDIKLFLTTPLWGRYKSISPSLLTGQLIPILQGASWLGGGGLGGCSVPDSQRLQTICSLETTIIKQNRSLIRDLPTSLKYISGTAQSFWLSNMTLCQWIKPFCLLKKIEYYILVLLHAQTCISLWINLLIPLISAKGNNFPVSVYIA